MRFIRSLSVVGLLVSLPLLTGLEECLGLCDFETDPNCEDPLRAQVEGTITVPEAGGEAFGFTRIDGSLRRAVTTAMTTERAKKMAPSPLNKGSRVIGSSKNNVVPSEKTRVEHFRPGEIIVVTLEPMRDRKAELGSAVKYFLSDALQREPVIDVGNCGTATRCLVTVTDVFGKKLDLSQTAEATTLLSNAPFVDYAEKNLILQIAAQPNDEFFTLQWHYAAMDLPAAWDITVGSSDTVAAIVDTGILLGHPDLGARVVGGADLISDEEAARDGDARDDDGDDPGDESCGGGCHSFHGSHVAGTMGAVTNNGDMVAGVTWEGRLLAVRVLGAGGGSLADIADGILWAIGADVDGVTRNDTPADVINMSLGGFGDSEVMNDAVAEAVAAGCIVIVAAGNDNTDASEFTPANAPDAITVAAHGNTGGGRDTPRRSSYSNFGDKVDIAAPGGETSEDIDGDGHEDGVLSTVDEFVSYYQGTSMASPHVAGIAMLLKSVDPSLNQENVRQLLTSSASPDLDCAEGCGAGRVSAVAALLASEGGLEGARVIASPSFLRVGRGQTETPVVFKNLGTENADISINIGGPERDQCSVSSDSGTVASEDTFVTTVLITRNDDADDRGECTITATFDDGSAEARVVWTPDVIESPTTVDVGAVRVDGDELRVARIVSTSAIEEFNYKLFNLEPGEYLIVGLVDTNQDGDYDDAEDAVGVFLPEDRSGDACPGGSCGRLELGEGTRVENADFVVAPGFTGDDGTGGTGDAVLGDGCTTSDECGGGLYCELDLVAGYCTTDCTDDGDCPNNGLCVSLVPVSGEEYQVCLKTCSVDADCRGGDGYFCDPADNTCFPE